MTTWKKDHEIKNMYMYIYGLEYAKKSCKKWLDTSVGSLNLVTNFRSQSYALFIQVCINDNCPQSRKEDLRKCWLVVHYGNDIYLGDKMTVGRKMIMAQGQDGDDDKVMHSLPYFLVMQVANQIGHKNHTQIRHPHLCLK